MTCKKPSRSTAGFSAAEMLVASVIAAMVLGAAAVAYVTLARGQRQYATTATVRLPSNAKSNFYAQSGNDITTFVAPNFGSLSRAEALRERFIADTSQAVAVFCLARANNVLNTIRPVNIPSPVFGEAALDTPEAFRAHLAAKVTGASSIFTTYRNTNSTANFSIFVLGYSQVPATIPVLAVYDLDVVACTDPNDTSFTIGSYATLRRYVNTSGTAALTMYYDVIYRSTDTTNDSFYPTVVAFERASRMAVSEGTAIDRFKVAVEEPFYFIFWPDPTYSSLALPPGNTLASLNPNIATSDPRKAYNHMGGRTAFWFTIPVFPAH
jgi:hypothetical protein